jgi:hypothetical protein
MFNKWTSIGGFHNVRKTLSSYDLYKGTITYRGKVKLHGTNAGVTITPDREVFAQSREIVLTADDDNAGFAKWVDSNLDYWKQLALSGQIVVVYGEWCGPGIQKNTAVNDIDEKVFAVFAIQIGESIMDDDGQQHAMVIVEPAAIQDFIALFVKKPKNIHVLPWCGDPIDVDYDSVPSLEAAIVNMNVAVASIETVDPWVKETFGVEGIGEGIVYYPISFADEGAQCFPSLDRWHLSTFMFKAKGDKHKGVKQKNAVQLDPEVASGIDEFVSMVVTEARLEQGAREVSGGDLVFEHRYIGPFLKWMGQDIQKETVDELEASNLTWSQVVKNISNASRMWYLAKIEEL